MSKNNIDSNPIGSIFEKMRYIFCVVSAKIKTRAKLLVIVTLSCSVMEAASVSIVVPMISMWMSADNATLSPWLQKGLLLAGITSRKDASMLIIAAFIFITIAGGILRIWLISLSARLSSDAGAELAEMAFARILQQKYEHLIGRNSSEWISVLNDKISTVTGIMLSILSLFNAALMLIFIWFGLLLVDTTVTFFTTGFFIILYSVVIYLTRKKIDYNSSLISLDSPRLSRSLRETFGSMRDIMLSGTHSMYQDSFAGLSRRLKTASAENILMSQSPRYIVEMIGLTAVALIAQILQGSESVSQTLPLLAALAIGAQRMLPLVQIIYSAYVNIRLSRRSLDDVLEVMLLPRGDFGVAISAEKCTRMQELIFDGVFFRYAASSQWTINNLSIQLASGSRIAVVGPSGVGKSTFLDLLTGLLEPNAGTIRVDDIPLSADNLGAWRQGIAYVPQAIFLIDETIASNIAFGVPKELINLDRVKIVCQVAEIADFVESRPGGYLAKMGEHGVLMSGGQRQRLGIARALYRTPRILILDEATNALDSLTEAKVLKNLYALEPTMTIIHVTHRIDVARGYDFILEFSIGNAVNYGTFDELILKSPSFNELVRHLHLGFIK